MIPPKVFGQKTSSARRQSESLRLKTAERRRSILQFIFFNPYGSVCHSPGVSSIRMSEVRVLLLSDSVPMGGKKLWYYLMAGDTHQVIVPPANSCGLSWEERLQNKFSPHPKHWRCLSTADYLVHVFPRYLLPTTGKAAVLSFTV